MRLLRRVAHPGLAYKLPKRMQVASNRRSYYGRCAGRVSGSRKRPARALEA